MSHNTLRRHLHLLGLLESPFCRKYGVREETSAHILCKCEALALLRHMYLGSFFLEPEDIWSLGLGATWNFSKATGLPWFDMGHKGPAQKPRCIGLRGPEPKYQSIYPARLNAVACYGAGPLNVRLSFRSQNVPPPPPKPLHKLSPQVP